MPKKRFHNVIIFRPLEPLTGYAPRRDGYAKVHESELWSLFFGKDLAQLFT